MAVVTTIPTEQRVYSWGRLKMETGQFTQAATTTDDILIYTKLRHILFAEFSPLSGGSLEDTDVDADWNSSTGSDVVGGALFIDKAIADGTYLYTVYGKG